MGVAFHLGKRRDSEDGWSHISVKGLDTTGYFIDNNNMRLGM